MPPTSGVVWGLSSVVISSPRSARRSRFDGLGRLNRRGRAGAKLSGRLLDRLDDVDVASAAAEVAADPLANLHLAGLRVHAQQPGGLHDHPGRAEAALQAVLIPERLLEGMERGAIRHAFDRRDLRAVRLQGEHRARLGALPVDVNCAGTAVARVAADVRAGQAEDVTQEVN